MQTEKRLVYDSEFKWRINAIIRNRKRMGLPYDQLESVALGLIDLCPTVDAVEVVHGRWKQTGMHLLPYQCSVCESKEEGRTNYCPNCGARMKGGNEDG